MSNIMNPKHYQTNLPDHKVESLMQTMLGIALMIIAFIIVCGIY
jgi:hypothetical protein